jgi:hypothetical protein
MFVHRDFLSLANETEKERERGLTKDVWTLLIIKQDLFLSINTSCSSHLLEGGIERRLAAFVFSRMDVDVFRFCFRMLCSSSPSPVRVCEFRLSCHHTSYKVVMVMAFSLSSSSSSSSVYRLLLLINFA